MTSRDEVRKLKFEFAEDCAKKIDTDVRAAHSAWLFNLARAYLAQAAEVRRLRGAAHQQNSAHFMEYEKRPGIVFYFPDEKARQIFWDQIVIEACGIPIPRSTEPGGHK